MKWSNIKNHIVRAQQPIPDQHGTPSKFGVHVSRIGVIAIIGSVILLGALVYAGLGGGFPLGSNDCPTGTAPSSTTGECLTVIAFPICTDPKADGNYFGPEYWETYAQERPQYIFNFVPDNSACIYCVPGDVWSSADDQCITPADICPTTIMYNGSVDPNTVGDQTVFPIVSGTSYTEEGRLCGIFGCKTMGDVNYTSIATLHNPSLCSGSTGGDLCPNLDGIQTEIPDGYLLFRDGNCIPATNWCSNISGWTQPVLPVSSIPGVTYKRLKFQCRAFACATSPLVGTFDTIKGIQIVIESDEELACAPSGPKKPAVSEE